MIPLLVTDADSSRNPTVLNPMQVVLITPFEQAQDTVASVTLSNSAMVRTVESFDVVVSRFDAALNATVHTAIA